MSVWNISVTTDPSAVIKSGRNKIKREFKKKSWTLPCGKNKKKLVFFEAGFRISGNASNHMTLGLTRVLRSSYPAPSTDRWEAELTYLVAGVCRVLRHRFMTQHS